MKKIVLIGDQVCSDYTLVLRNILNGKVELWGTDLAVGSTVGALAGLREWVLKWQPDYVLIQTGILDTRQICFGDKERVLPLKSFERNVSAILRVILERSTSVPIWVTTTPVDVRRVESQEEFGYDNETISLYNEEAKAVARRLGVEVLDLYGIVKAASRADSWRPAGICFDERASDFIAETVAQKLRSFCDLD
ncbi:SGNH/GDSL hydrolase family protein [Pelagicoccus sp. SDUM812003]|uniref:SGNH/GDSL hydrolase family protein n=1 Tax=Pelagicoccus sp. SDUM812003 TaxID=3041267 RepID=UPI00280C40EA|nr:SGNH/GDSL hydrolase family protein [Pelagicoccus sp. SDUM812003]MDQ8201688.1 SGNH/GDSL hydrolase family protein [Pelagicoccus sp. SDUM812003]